MIRDLAQDVFQSFKDNYGAKLANYTMHKIFPACIAERWNRCHASEERFLAAGCERLCLVLEDVLITQKLLAKAEQQAHALGRKVENVAGII